MYSFITHNDLIINEQFLDILMRLKLDDFQSLLGFGGGSYIKKNPLRPVVRLQLEDKTFYLKRHFWPWKHVIKALRQRIRNEDARNEWENMTLLDKLGFNTMVPVAFGYKKRMGLPHCSLTLTEAIQDVEKLETYLPRHFFPPLSSDKIAGKRRLIRNLAAVARDFHDRGLNHQDFYLVHLFVRPEDEELFIVDLQRVHHKKKISAHDRIKDLAELAFSARALDIFTRTDFMRFAQAYLLKYRLDRTDKKMIGRILRKSGRIGRHTLKLIERSRKASGV